MISHSRKCTLLPNFEKSSNNAKKLVQIIKKKACLGDPGKEGISENSISYFSKILLVHCTDAALRHTADIQLLKMPLFHKCQY